MITRQTSVQNHSEKKMNGIETEQTDGSVCTTEDGCINCDS
jgi:hypothetical protein